MKDDQLFALAGVRRHWYSPDRKSQMDSFAVITTEPNELMAEMTGHDRMPVIIKRRDYEFLIESAISISTKAALLIQLQKRTLHATFTSKFCAQ